MIPYRHTIRSNHQYHPNYIERQYPSCKLKINREDDAIHTLSSSKPARVVNVAHARLMSSAICPPNCSKQPNYQRPEHRINTCTPAPPNEEAFIKKPGNG